MHDFWLPSSLLLGLYALTAGGLQQLSAHERHLGLLSFFAGAFSAISVIDLFFGAEYPDAYQLFYLPAMRVALVLAVPALFYWYSDLIGWIRYIVLAGIFLLPFLFGVVAVLSLSNLVLPAVVTAIFLFVVCTFAGMTAVGGVRSLIR
jgi:hypothetical protein